jgi:WD40 repeat protein
VLFLAVSPDGTNIVTGAGDETLRFWNAFPPCGSGRGASGTAGGSSGLGGGPDAAVASLSRSTIR